MTMHACTCVYTPSGQVLDIILFNFYHFNYSWEKLWNLHNHEVVEVSKWERGNPQPQWQPCCVPHLIIQVESIDKGGHGTQPIQRMVRMSGFWWWGLPHPQWYWPLILSELPQVSPVQPTPPERGTRSPWSKPRPFVSCNNEEYGDPRYTKPPKIWVI